MHLGISASITISLAVGPTFQRVKTVLEGPVISLHRGKSPCFISVPALHGTTKIIIESRVCHGITIPLRPFSAKDLMQLRQQKVLPSPSELLLEVNGAQSVIIKKEVQRYNSSVSTPASVIVHRWLVDTFKNALNAAYCHKVTSRFKAGTRDRCAQRLRYVLRIAITPRSSILPLAISVGLAFVSCWRVLGPFITSASCGVGIHLTSVVHLFGRS